MTAQDSRNHIYSGEVASPFGGHCFSRNVDYQGVGMRHQFPVERKWTLGLKVLYFTC